jgi:thiol:disulfide interchange protein DsbC
MAGMKMMKSTQLASLVALLLPMVAAAADTAALKAQLQQKYPESKILSVAPSGEKGWYEVVTDEELVYTNEDGTRLFVGRMIDSSTRQDLTSRRWNALQSIDFKVLPLDQAIKTVRGNGKRTLVLFADPLCPFCQELETPLGKLDNVTIYLFLYPLEDLHPGATARAAKIWCAADRSTAWSDWMLSRKETAFADCDQTGFKAGIAIGNKLKINSTPTMFFVDGHRASGVLEAAALEKELTAAP